LSQFRDKADEFERLEAQLMGISVDSFYSHAAFAEKLQLNFPLLSDFNRQVVPFYTGYYDGVSGLRGVGRRRVMVIDRGGTVRFDWSTEKPKNLPDIEEVLKAVRGLGTRAVGQ
jgi:peroxiredoxin